MSQQKDAGQLVVNSASWSDLAINYDGVITGPLLQYAEAGLGSDGSNPVNLMYGGEPLSLPAYFPTTYGECSEAGTCSDGSRWAIWPDSPPLITDVQSDGSVTGYTWIPLAYIDGLTRLNPNSGYTLYKTSYTPNSDKNVLPTGSVVSESFWQAEQIGYGNYGGVVPGDGYAYLYGQTANPVGTTLARVPVGSVEDVSAYEYYVSGAWTSTMPGLNDTAAIVANAGAGGQGTFYHSAYLNAYVWIGQGGASNYPAFLVTTAPAPEGPWNPPQTFWTGQGGDFGIAPGYSLQAHPALLPSGVASENAIYLTFTQAWEDGPYITPLIYVEWN